MKYYVVLTRLEIPLVEPLPGETKAANIVNEACGVCTFDFMERMRYCKDHYQIKSLVLVERKIELPAEAENVIEFVVPAETTPTVVEETVPEPEAVPA